MENLSYLVKLLLRWPFIPDFRICLELERLRHGEGSEYGKKLADIWLSTLGCNSMISSRVIRGPARDAMNLLTWFCKEIKSRISSDEDARKSFEKVVIATGEKSVSRKTVHWEAVEILTVLGSKNAIPLLKKMLKICIKKTPALRGGIDNAIKKITDRCEEK